MYSSILIKRTLSGRGTRFGDFRIIISRASTHSSPQRLVPWFIWMPANRRGTTLSRSKLASSGWHTALSASYNVLNRTTLVDLLTRLHVRYRLPILQINRYANLSFRQRLWAAAKADTLSILAFQVGGVRLDGNCIFSIVFEPHPRPNEANVLIHDADRHDLWIPYRLSNEPIVLAKGWKWGSPQIPTI